MNTTNLQFAKKKISQFPMAEELLRTALIPVVQNCDNYNTTPEQLAQVIGQIIGAGTQSDWNVTDTTDTAFIKNKPTILSQSDVTNLIASALTNYYTKSQTMSTTEINNAITQALNGFKVEVFNKNVALTVTQFELDANVNTSYDRNVTGNITLTETSASSALTNVATICTVGYTNTSSGSVTITIPNTGNNKSMMESTLTLEAGKYVEVAMKGSGSKRV